MNLRMDTVVRVATVNDLAVATSLEPYRTSDEVLRRIEDGLIYLAESDRKVVGYARLEAFWPTMPYLGLIRVEPAERGGGIGKQMVAFIAQHLRAKGHTALLSSSQTDEPEPQRWHRSAGFVKCGELAELNAEGVGEVFFILRF
jgi:L-amino acid N-acyltransferase YncA